MASSEQQQSSNPISQPGGGAPQQQAAPQSLDAAITKLAKAGGFGFMEATVEGIQNLNPERKARKQIFLTDPEKKKEREALQKRMELWLRLLQEGGDLSQMIATGEQKATQAGKVLQQNLKNHSGHHPRTGGSLPHRCPVL